MKINFNLTKNERLFLLAEGVFVILLLGFVFLYTSPEAVSPVSGKVVSNNDFLFNVENGNEIILANNKEFTNPVVLDEDSYVTLTPGEYYWKVKGRFRESEVKSFVIREVVGLEINKRNDIYELRNSGTVDLNVSEIIKNESITSGMIVEVGEVKKVEKDNSTYEGRKNE